MARPTKKTKGVLTSFFRSVGAQRISWEKLQKLDKAAIEDIIKSQQCKKPYQKRASLHELLNKVPEVRRYYSFLSQEVRTKSIAQIARDIGSKEETVAGHLKFFRIEPLSTGDAIRSGITRRMIKEGRVPGGSNRIEGHFNPSALVKNAQKRGVLPTPETKSARHQRFREISERIKNKKKRAEK